MEPATRRVGRHTFLTFASAGAGTLERERAGRILIWFLAAAPFWIAGALTDDSTRVALWLAALAIDLVAPLALYWVPGRPRLEGASWTSAGRLSTRSATCSSACG